MKKLFTLFTICILATGIAFASFPVKKVEETNKTEAITVTTDDVASSLEMKKSEVKQLIKKEMKKNKKSSSLPDDFWILFLLWFFLGGLAAHRWYAGKPVGWNILFILTGGGCLIWAIIDLIHIIKGDFK